MPSKTASSALSTVGGCPGQRSCAWGATAVLLLWITAAFPFFVVPPARAFHDWRDDVPCLDCHSRLPLHLSSPRDLRFLPTIQTVCRSCHAEAHPTPSQVHSHPLIVRTDLVLPPDMPKDDEGRMNCMTCHYYHPSNGSQADLLRRPLDENFCLACHTNGLP